MHQDIKALVTAKYPQFQNSDFVENKEGWANRVYIVDNAYIFRFPRNTESYNDLLRERMILPQLKKVATIAIPDFKYESLDEEKRPFVGYPMIAGIQLTKEHLAAMTDAEQDGVARSIALFLEGLHSETLSQFAQANGLRHKTLDQWILFKNHVFEKAKIHLTETTCQIIEAFFSEFVDLMKTSAPGEAVIHGDFSSDHILFDEHRKVLTGIIDFGDIQIGDPAFDFTGLYMDYGKEFAERVLSYYTLNKRDFLERIERFYIKQVPLHSLLYGIEQNEMDMVNVAIGKLR